MAGAIAASTIANVNRSKGRAPFKIADFMVVEKMVAEAEKPPVDVQQDRLLQRMIVGLGGSIP